MVTLKDIAVKAGVNVSTVSRALNGSSEISENTKKIIKDIAYEVNYVPNVSARALVGKGTKSIGVIVPEIGSNYFAQMLNFIEAELKTNSYSLVVGMTHHNYKEEIQYLNVFGNGKVDGIIIAGSMHKELKQYLVKFKQNYHTPVVLVQTFVHFPDCDYIMIDDVHGICMAIQYLKEQGHREIGLIADKVSSSLRLPAYKEAMKRNGLKVNERFIKIGKEMFELGGYLQMKELLKEKVLPTAIWASYDYIAIGATKALYEKGMTVPQDMSIIGYDDIRESLYLTPPLTTISPPIKEMAEVGVNLLIKRIEDKDNRVIQHVSFKPNLIIRSTTSKV